jgi:hypothetical protein
MSKRAPAVEVVGAGAAPCCGPSLCAPPHEAAYVDRQQGAVCVRCGCNLRNMALARAILGVRGSEKTLAAFATGPGRGLDILEVNEAGGLTQFLRCVPGHRIGSYPDVDLHALPFPDESFDLVSTPTRSSTSSTRRQRWSSAGACCARAAHAPSRCPSWSTGLRRSPEPGHCCSREVGQAEISAW